MNSRAFLFVVKPEKTSETISNTSKLEPCNSNQMEGLVSSEEEINVDTNGI